jgi:hypothetical protein
MVEMYLHPPSPQYVFMVRCLIDKAQEQLSAVTIVVEIISAVCRRVVCYIVFFHLQDIISDMKMQTSRRWQCL